MSSRIKKILNWKALFVGLFVLSSVFVVFFFLTCRSQEPVKKKTPLPFVSVPITHFSSTNVPCVDLRIGDDVIPTEIDLGFRGDLSIQSDFIEQIKEKTFVRIRSMYGIRGKEYKENLYLIPKAKIGKMAFINPRLQESSFEFLMDSIFVKDESVVEREPGRIGWEFFYNVNLFLDCQNKTVAFCDSLDDLRERGYDPGSFIKAPILLDRGLVEFNAITSQGPLRCMLDTGSTWNLLHTESDLTPEEIAKDPTQVFLSPTFKIANHDVGSTEFLRMPLRLPIQLEAIIGMEFIMDHPLFIDFSNRAIYIFPESFP